MDISERLRDLPCRGHKVVLATPTYGHGDPACQKDLRVAMMMAMNRGLVWCGDSSTDRMGYSAGRNAVAQSVLNDKDAEGIVWVDSDIRMEPDTIARMVSGALENHIEMMSAIYHQRLPPYAPVLYSYNGMKNQFRGILDYPENVYFPVGGCGFGCVYTAKAVIEKIARSKDFVPKEGWFPDKRDAGGFGEDLAFCAQANKVNVDIYADTGIHVGHSGDPYVVTRKDFLEHRSATDAFKGEVVEAVVR